MFAWLLVTSCSPSGAGSDLAPDARPPGSTSSRIRRVQAVPIGQLRYRIVVDIDNFFTATQMNAAVTLPTAFDITDPLFPPPTYRLVDRPRLELDTEPLHAFTSYQTLIELRWSEGAVDRAGHYAFATHDWVSGPPELTTGPAPTIGDTGVVTVAGNGLGKITGMQLALPPDPASTSEVRIDLWRLVCSHTQCAAQVPIVLSPAPVLPRRFTGAAPTATVHLIQPSEIDGAAHHDVAAGTTQLVYQMSSANPGSGAPGSEFSLALFHPARAPNLDGLTVLFDDHAIAPAGVLEQSQHTTLGDLYFTVARFRVPGAAEPGLHRIRGVTAFGDELSCADHDFTVTAP